MRKLLARLAVIVSLFMTLILAIFATSSVAATHYIKADGTGDFVTIQDGIDAAAVGDTVLLAAGTYTGAGNKDLDFGGKELVLRSESGWEVTLIDCEGSGRGLYFHSGEGSAAVVEGLMILNGDVAGDGGGIYCDGASPTITSCTFLWNSATSGGGMFCDNFSSPALTNCYFSQNSASFRGGGLYCYRDSSPTLTDCNFSSNTATSGGGMFCYGRCSPTMSHCVILANSVTSYGGGMYCYDSCYPDLTNCTFSANSGSVGGGIRAYSGSNPTLQNTIIAFCSGGEAVSCDGTSGATLTCCDVYGNSGGDWVGCIAAQNGINGNFSADPQFCLTSGIYYHLHGESPCAPGNHPSGDPCSELLYIGAYPVSCGETATEKTTWSALKSLYAK